MLNARLETISEPVEISLESEIGFRRLVEELAREYAGMFAHAPRIPLQTKLVGPVKLAQYDFKYTVADERTRETYFSVMAHGCSSLETAATMQVKSAKIEAPERYQDRLEQFIQQLN